MGTAMPTANQTATSQGRLVERKARIMPRMIVMRSAMDMEITSTLKSLVVVFAGAGFAWVNLVDVD